MEKSKVPESEIDILRTIINPMFSDDIEQQILCPLSCSREFESKWVLEFDLPLVNKKDISISLDEGNAITVEAKLKETYVDSSQDYKHEFQYFKKSVQLPGKIDTKNIITNFTNGRLMIIIPKLFRGTKVKVE